MTDKRTWLHNLSQLNIIDGFNTGIKLPYIIQVLSVPQCCKLIKTMQWITMANINAQLQKSTDFYDQLNRHLHRRSVWIYSLVFVSDFAKCCENGPVAMLEMLISPKIHYYTKVMGVEKIIWNLYLGPDHTKKLINSILANVLGLIITPIFNEIWRLLLQ